MVNGIGSLQLSDFIDRHKNTPAVIVGSAPDILSFPFNSFQGLVFGMGDSPLRGVNMFETDYWVFANAHWIRPWIQRDSAAIKYIKPKNTFIATSIFAFQELNTINQKIEKSIREIGSELVFYDQRHSKCRDSCDPIQGCCVAKKILGIEYTIQELLSKYLNQTEKYSGGSTVALHTLALAILMGCNPISIVGVQIPKLQKDYVYYRTPEVDKLQKTFGSCGPYANSDLGLYYAQLVHNYAQLVHKTRWLAKSSCSTFQKAIFPHVLSQNYEVQKSLFASDRIQIKADFEFMIYKYSLRGGIVRNYSKNSLLSEVRGVLDIDRVD